ncbi:uncharacterized protein LOC115624270 [Scaptodrosophila lebanonensis]|uniref:Uncharacterized protein LOC115624270 n=1 Tax=Drosophila lebanonensis TaxID=7225 RepID=A0A6J2TIA9_DROLE|nr:uncharacterized protein LOC115624270 [Scaptodrosophila lebanonensis]XP_030374757.1 uncharacterized protein LOC115624270 [Scaptodrosophila lebanonensis]
MNAHSTDVGLDVQLKLQHLQMNHVRIREQLTRLMRKRHDALMAQLDYQRRIYEGKAEMEQRLQLLQLKYGRKWLQIWHK